MKIGKSAFGLDSNIAAGLAYLPIFGVHLIMSIIIIATEKNDKLSRFHAFQSLLLLGAAIVGYIGVWIVMAVIMVGASAMNMPALSFLGFLVLGVFVLALLGSIVMCLIKAFGGQIYKLPVIGNMADNWSN